MTYLKNSKINFLIKYEVFEYHKKFIHRNIPFFRLYINRAVKILKPNLVDLSMGNSRHSTRTFKHSYR